MFSKYVDANPASFTRLRWICWNWRARRYLVAPRGRTQWVRNAEAAGEITLKKGRTRQKFRLRPIVEAEKLKILKAYLDNFKREVQRYFPIPAGSPPQAFQEVEPSYPAFELLPS